MAITLSVTNKPILPSVVCLNVIMLSVGMLNGIMLSVVMLNVVVVHKLQEAPPKWFDPFHDREPFHK